MPNEREEAKDHEAAHRCAAWAILYLGEQLKGVYDVVGLAEDASHPPETGSNALYVTPLKPYMDGMDMCLPLYLSDTGEPETSRARLKTAETALRSAGRLLRAIYDETGNRRLLIAHLFCFDSPERARF